jgi:glycosyltransferase involved in cell wall biosynthesis
MKLLFIGAINQGHLPKGGEEYKNQILTKKIKEHFSKSTIIDTSRWSEKPYILIMLLLSFLFKRWHFILISASSVSTYRLLRLIGFLRPKILKKITYLVIGGYLPEGIRSERFDWKVYRGLNKIVVQGHLLSNTILKYSELSNIVVLPNFKDFPQYNIPKVINNTGGVFKFVFVGRISENKGIKEILEALGILRKGEFKFRTDFFGPIEDDFKMDTEISAYCGFLDFQVNAEQSYSRLAEYDCLLFPTYWIGEGFPGVIIDAFVAGLPVIATDWNMNQEIIEDNVNGFIIEPKNANALADKMSWVMENRSDLKSIGENNRKKANEYHIDKVWPKLIAHVVS